MSEDGGTMRHKRLSVIIALLMCSLLMAGCAGSPAIDDYAVNDGYELTGSGSNKASQTNVTGGSSAGIAKDKIKVGVIHLSDPAEGSGYTYTHDIGIQGMQQNLGLSDSQIVRKNNISDTDAAATRKAIKECIDDGCNVIFTTSWGYMQTTAEMAEEYPDIYFSHGTGYMAGILTIISEEYIRRDILAE